MADSEARKKAMQAVQSFLDVYRGLMKENDFKGYDRQLMHDLRLIDAEPTGGALWEMDVTEHWVNMNGVMHGGAYAVIFDMCTAIAMNPIARDGYWEFLAGVTRSLNISYLRAIPIGTTVRIRANVLQHGKTMTLLRGVMESVDGKTIYATAEHHKVAVDAKPQHANRLRNYRAQMQNEPSGKL
ncbi:hypothetical protein D8B26_005919 [Coccidioides posadasii str. Silveira]|uniref:Uncharacterized protein n=2 Tax=Coccidioides posadasii TaxID=199306 RepID=E9DIB4_COCPS|nr:conserved hypothetical protein [Coccidioides posadasii str. Silveira]KMM67953.1 hypothetical protein CPAG_04286 [Coccidioides posadasii RMSCC 3488]QVM11265.1 hypothetical protein D8B26_005919 [Coccidioides posadasii str. Silveira]